MLKNVVIVPINLMIDTYKINILCDSMAKREHIPARLRHEVFKRDKYRCRECGATNKETTLEIDHIVPVAKGGSNNLSNLQTLCKACNRAKHTRTWVGGSYVSPLRKQNRLYNTESSLDLKKQISNYFDKRNIEYEGNDYYKNHGIIFDEFNNTKEFMDALTDYGVELNCLIPYYGHTPQGNIDVIYPKLIERFKNVKLLNDGIYVDDVFHGQTLRIPWVEISAVHYRNESICIDYNKGNIVIIYLPVKFNVLDDIKRLISDKTINKFNNKLDNSSKINKKESKSILDKSHLKNFKECPKCGTFMSLESKGCINCNYVFKNKSNEKNDMFHEKRLYKSNNVPRQKNLEINEKEKTENEIDKSSKTNGKESKNTLNQSKSKNFKECPKCGTFMNIKAKNCINCNYEFKKYDNITKDINSNTNKDNNSKKYTENKKSFIKKIFGL